MKIYNFIILTGFLLTSCKENSPCQPLLVVDTQELEIGFVFQNCEQDEVSISEQLDLGYSNDPEVDVCLQLVSENGDTIEEGQSHYQRIEVYGVTEESVKIGPNEKCEFDVNFGNYYPILEKGNYSAQLFVKVKSQQTYRWIKSGNFPIRKN